MPQTPAAKHRAPLAVPLLLAALAGCQTHPRPTPAGGRDLAQARALARYATGFMLSADAEKHGQPPPPAALDAFLASHRLDPASSGPAEAAARLLVQKNRADETLELLARHASFASAPAHAFHQLGLFAEFIGKNPAAIRAHAAALKSPGLPEALRLPVVAGLVRACMAEGSDEQAFQVLKREAAANPARRATAHAIADAWACEFSNGADFARAARAARFAATLAPSREALVSAKRLEARALEQDGKTRTAKKILSRLAEPKQ